MSKKKNSSANNEAARKPASKQAPSQKKSNFGVPLIIVAAVVLVIGALVVFSNNSKSGLDTASNSNVSADGGSTSTANSAAAVVNQDVVIPVADITETARFYPVEIDGTRLEVLAVKASDGTIRTAFNTCQVCYDSGMGYYVQEGDELVCQNCKNRFHMSQVEITAGGCNPVPIFPENKTVTADTITISQNYLNESKTIFGNWKTQQ